MKKLLALVLALIMVLGLGVTAFAVAAPEKITLINLTKEVKEDDELETIITLPEFDGANSVEGVGGVNGNNETIYLAAPEGDDYYLEIANYDDYKNITVTTTGGVTAEIVKFDPEKQEYPAAWGVHFYVVDGKGVLNDAHNNACVKGDTAKGILGDEEFDEAIEGLDEEYTYDWADAIAKALNKKYKYSRFSAVAFEQVNEAWVKLEKNLLKITTADNYSAAYKEGTVKLTAVEKDTKKTKIAKLTVISDVNIFEYEQVKWAVDDAEALVIGDNGYSDYLTAKLGYNLDHPKTSYDPDDLRAKNATVVSTTAFRAIEGEELVLESDVAPGTNKPLLTVTIDEVAKGQKGVNFDYDTLTYYDEDDEKIKKADGTAPDYTDLKGEVEYFEFGFLGDQAIASDFEIEVKLPWNRYQLRELFGKKVEEEDVITYYVLKDDVKIYEFTVDYKDDDIDDPIELEIIREAGDTLGYYTITLDAPAAAEEEGEENPNTGAESVVGVVAAMAVISLATAAAVSLKK